MSSDLVWNLVKNNSCFLRKQKNAQFTCEPNNLTAMNTKKYSGLPNEKALGLSFDAKLMAEPKAMRKVVLTRSAPKNAAYPNVARGCLISAF